MKLIFCPNCQDVIKMAQTKRSCACGKSWGQYHGPLQATFGGMTIPLGFDNHSLRDAIQLWKTKERVELGCRFTAFIMPSTAPTCVPEQVGESHKKPNNCS